MNKALKKFRPINILIILLIFVAFLILRQRIHGFLPILFLITVLSSYLLWFLRDYIDLTSPKVHEILVIILLLGICWFTGKLIGLGKYWIIGVVVGCIYLAVLFKKPEYMLLVSIILITNMFSLLNSDLFRIKGIFKLRDLILFIPFIPIIVKEFTQRKNIKFIFGSISAYTILGFCVIILLFIMATSLRHSSPFVLSFRIGRDYFYYLFFFMTVYSIQKKSQLDFILKAMIVLSLLFAVMYIIQAISGGAIHLFPTSSHTRGKLLGVSLTRSYVFFGFTGIICAVFIGLLGVMKSRRTKIWILIGLSLLLGASFFTFGRAYWIKIGIIIFLVFLFLAQNEKKGFIEWISGALLIFVSFIALIGILRYGSLTLLFKGGTERVSSGITDVIHSSGTYGYRRKALTLYKDMIKQNLWFGLGFLYQDAKITKTIPFKTTIFGHNSFVTILNTMGITGLFIHIILYLVFIIRGFFIFSRVKNPIYKGFILGFIAWYIGDWVVIFTKGVMIFYYYLSIKAMCVGITESIYRIDKEKVGNIIEIE